jgi:hypothetical protein
MRFTAADLARNDGVLMAVGGFIPLFDYNGQRSHYIEDFDTMAQIVSFNILAAEGHAVVAMLWFKDHDQGLAIARKLAASHPGQPHRSCSKLQIPNIFQNLPEGWLRRATHGSICIQEGQPPCSPLFHSRSEQLHRLALGRSTIEVRCNRRC